MEDQETMHPEHDHPRPKRSSTRRQLVLSIVVMTLLVLATIMVVLYGKGYRLGFHQGEPQLSKTGILQASSSPTGAQVYIDGKLVTATDNAINLTPGKYSVTIAKDGYNDWQKDIEIKREVVSNADALLLPKAPTLQSISTFGVESAVVDPTGSRIAFRIASSSAKKNGIYVMDMTNRVFPVLAGQSSSTQLVDESTDTFSKAEIMWSPDGKQILATIPLGEASTAYLLKTDGLNQTPQNITTTKQTVLDAWQNQLHDKQVARLKSLKAPLQKFINENFRVLSWSPDDTKILYQASHSAQMPVIRKPRLIGNNLLYERRDLKEGAIYVYDSKEDVNTRIIDTISPLCSEIMSDCTCSDSQNCILPFTWFPDSGHLIYVHDKKIEIVEKDGSNMTTVYAGPFIDHYVFPWTDGSKIVVLTNLNNSNTQPTLYTITLK